MFNWFARQRAPQRAGPGHLNNVLAGARVIGYVDDGSGIYDLDRREVGYVEFGAQGTDCLVRSANRSMAGLIAGTAEAANGGYWHKVYDDAHRFVGLVDNGSEIADPLGRTLGSVVYNEGNGGTGWLRAGAALILLILPMRQ